MNTKKKYYYYCSLILFFISAHPSYSQQAGDPGSQPGWKDTLSISAGYNLSRTTRVETSSLYEIAYNASYQETWDLVLNAGGAYSKTKRELTRNEHKTDLQTDRWIAHSMWSITYLGKIETNEVQQVYYTFTTGLGIKVQPLRLWWIHFSISSMPTFEKQRTWNFTEDTDKLRILSKAGMKINFSRTEPDSRTFSISYVYDPNALDVYDYKMNLEATLSLKIIGNLMWETKYTYNLVSNPVKGSSQGGSAPTAGGQEKTYSLSSGLRLNLDFYKM